MNHYILPDHLLKNSKIHADIFRILPNPGIVLESDFSSHTIIYANEAFSSLVGDLENNLIGKSYMDVFADKTDLCVTDWNNLINKAISENIPVKLPTIKFDKNSTVYDIPNEQIYLVGSLIPVLDTDGVTTQVICFFTDVTEFRLNDGCQKVATVDRENELLKEAQRIARIGSWEVNLDNNTIIWSDLTKEIYEVDYDFVPSSEAVRAFFNNAMEHETLVTLVQQSMESGNLFDSEIQITSGRGNILWIRITGQAEYIAGHCNRIFGTVQDITKKRQTEDLLTESRNKLQSLVQSVNGIMWEADPMAFEFTFVSDHVKDILGYTPEEWLGEPYFWENHIHPDDLQNAITYCQTQVSNLKNHNFDYRMIKADGSIIWIKDVVSVIIEEGRPTCLRGFMVDITDTKRIEELNTLEKSVLELNATNDKSLHEVLFMYLKGIEDIFPEMQCSFHQVKENCLEFALAPSIPSTYLQILYNVPIGPSAGSCGTAAFRKERVIVSDIANDPKWTDYAEVALKYNLRACWSEPIINSEGTVIATLGFYYKKVRFPQENELIVIDRTSSILKVILENRHKSILLEESSILMQQGQELAGFGNWQWDILNNVVRWSDVLYNIYGLDKTSFKATFEGYHELLHPDDMDRVKEGIMVALRDKTDIIFEERIVRPDGEIRHLKSWARVQSDENGTPVKMLGACLDITENKKNQDQLMTSESRLRNIVNAQTNYVMRVDLDGKYTYYNNKYFEDFSWIFSDGELFGTDSMATVVPLHQARVRETFLKCIQETNKVFQVEIDKIAPGGTVRSTFWHFICLTNPEGEPFEIQCIGLDITDKKNAEDALKKSNERYEYVNKATNDAIYDYSSETGHVKWGEGFTRLFGFETAEEYSYTLDDWKNHIHLSDRERVLESLNKTLNDSDQQRWQSSYRFRKNCDGYASVQENGYILRNDEGQMVRMIGVLRDITKQKQEEHHLKLLESVITQANDLIMIAQADPLDRTSLGIIYINGAFTRITGYELHEVNGKNPLLFTGYDLNSSDRNKWTFAIENGIALQMETSLSKKNGTQFWVSLSLNPVEDEKGLITHWVSIIHDISEARRNTDAIEQQNEKLKIIAFMQSHVVRAPLARLMGAVDLVKNYNNSPQENKQFLDYILTSAHELDRIIREISEKAN